MLINKYPGGYTIVDLGGLLITAVSTGIDKEIGEKIRKSKKPVILTNFELDSNANCYSPDWGLMITSVTDDYLTFRTVPMITNEGTAMYVEVYADGVETDINYVNFSLTVSA